MFALAAPIRDGAEASNGPWQPAGGTAPCTHARAKAWGTATTLVDTAGCSKDVGVRGGLRGLATETMGAALNICSHRARAISVPRIRKSPGRARRTDRFFRTGRFSFSAPFPCTPRGPPERRNRDPPKRAAVSKARERDATEAARSLARVTARRSCRQWRPRWRAKRRPQSRCRSKEGSSRAAPAPWACSACPDRGSSWRTLGGAP